MLCRSPHANRSSVAQQLSSSTAQQLHLLQHHPSPVLYLSAPPFDYLFSPQVYSSKTFFSLTTSPLPNADLWVSSSGFQNLGLILSIILSKVLAQTADSSKEGNSFLSLRLNLLVQIALDICETF